jgi:hypothetical protein
MLAGVRGWRDQPGRRRRSRRASAAAIWRLLSALVALGLLLAGCSYSREEPGLFPRPSEAPQTTEAPKSRLPPQPTNKTLPVAGEAIWTTGEGLRVTVRFAVHAVRRIQGATVLDWSVTPLSARGLSAGDQLPDWIDLGLSRQTEGDANIVLLDTAHKLVYRPLAHRSPSEFRRCLCSPLWVAQLSLRIGETRMLQLSFPQLPASLDYVDVQLANVAPFWHVPVTPLGMAPTAEGPTNLARLPDPAPALSSPQPFRYPPDGWRRQSIWINRIIANPRVTAVEWTMHSITDQPTFSLLSYGPPVSAALPEELLILDRGSASGPQIRPVLRDGRSLGPMKAQFMTARVQGAEFYECLCTAINIWAASLRRAGGSASVTTTYGALPAGVTRVDVILPGVTTISSLPITRAADSAARLATPTAALNRTWTYSVESPPRGWSTYDWPTPTPELSQLKLYNSFVEDITRLPGW